MALKNEHFALVNLFKLTNKIHTSCTKHITNFNFFFNSKNPFSLIDSTHAHRHRNRNASEMINRENQTNETEKKTEYLHDFAETAISNQTRFYIPGRGFNDNLLFTKSPYF